jgi:hypothetical protein
MDLDFETPTSGITNLQLVTKTSSAITEVSGSGFGTSATKGLVMDGTANAAWQTPVGILYPWTSNPDNFAGAYISFSPNAATYDSLLMHLDLKQLFNTANVNTNFPITVNGTQVGPTYRPPFSGTPINWMKIKVNLNAYKHLENIQIGLESSVKDIYANGNGTANMIDNIHIERKMINGLGPERSLTDLVVYPNPSNGIFNLQLPEAIQNYELEVKELSGKVVLKQNAGGGAFSLNLNSLAIGIYILKITNNNSSIN